MKFIRSIIIVCAILMYAPVMMAAEADPTTGTVTETIDAGGYVYIKLEEQGTWIASKPFAVSVGDKIQYSGGAEMKGFHSKTLDRTFESIFFVSSASLVGKDSSTKHGAGMEGRGWKEMTWKEPEPVQVPVAGEITALEDGKTIAAIFAESGQLEGQMVSLNARVMKVNKNIMGRNWITLQDGTGVDPDHELLATSQELVAPGDLVVAKGTVVVDMDLGYGYTYKVLLEEAAFSAGVE